MTDSTESQKERGKQCLFCDWPQEWEDGDLCILHSFEFWSFWRPLAEFGPIPTEDSHV